MSKIENRSCGVIMPISSIDGCSGEHWSEVLSILRESLESISEFNFSVSLVSDADEIGVIQKRIVQNTYSSDLVVCDVSGKNPNVMFELGMRLAFDKPTIIVKDDKTDYSFDTGVIEHLEYPRDLRFSSIVKFKEKLAEKALATYQKSVSDPDHSTFLKNFGQFQVANLTEDVVSPDRIVISMLSDMQKELSSIRARSNQITHQPRERLAGPIPTGIRMKRSFLKYAKEHECELSKDLIGDESFYTFVEQDIDAPKIFDDRDKFKDTVDRMLAKQVA